jgi:hypothetical protein
MSKFGVKPKTIAANKYCKRGYDRINDKGSYWR